MRLEDLKGLMLLPKKEYLINQSINIRGIDVHILSFTIEEDGNRLWLLYEQEEIIEDEMESDMENECSSRTNREEKIENIERNKRDRSFFIEEMTIQKQTIGFNSSSSSIIGEMNIEGIIRLGHFIEKGLIPNKWDDVRLKNLVIAQYEQGGNQDQLVLDRTKELDIKLKIGPDSKEVLIEHPFRVKYGKQDKGTKIDYFDKGLGKTDYFFINEIYSFDPYQYIEDLVEQVEGLERGSIMFNNLVDGIESLCPRDKNLALIKYETRDDSQLNFYLKNFLDGYPIDYRNTTYSNDGSNTGGASSIGFIWSSKEKGIGINGYKLRECILQPIDKDFSGQLEIELFSRYIQIPGEKVE